MSDAVLVALIAAVPGTITAVATLLEVTYRRREAAAAPAPRSPAAPPEPPPPTQPTPRSSRPLPPRGSQLRLPVIVIGGLVLTVAVALLAAAVLDTEDGPSSVSVSVSGTKRWTNTGLNVSAGDEVAITASGEVFHSVEQQRKAGPDGEPNTKYPSNVLMSADHGALLGMIGGDGDPFFVGDDRRFRAEQSGVLYLGINDTGIENNSGAFEADITVRDDG
ncbi:MAG: hypothetical protein ACRDQ2_02930 [Gaiellales bacterium]